MSTLTEVRKITIEEFENLPPFEGIQELLDGEVVEVPPVKKRHSVLVRRIERLLRGRVDESLVWIETGFLFGRNCLQPDVAVSHPDQSEERGWHSGAPLIAVEVASRGNTPEELEYKKEVYLANGASEVWIVFDKTKTVEWYGPGGVSRTCRDVLRSEVLSAEIRLDEIFA